MQAPLPVPRDVGHPVRVLPWLSPVLRAGLELMLEPHADRVVLVTGYHLDPDVVVVDPVSARTAGRMDESGDVPVVWLTGYPCEGARDRARQHRAVRSLELDTSAADIVAVLTDVARCTRTERSQRPVRTLQPDDLSVREVQVVSLICRGLSNDEIAAELFLSLNTIKTYIRTAYRKMGVRSRSQAVLWGLHRGMDEEGHGGARSTSTTGLGS